ncbi:hypothetical protein DL546_003941 [Coniochaeta pulveracea]|uniref:Uncharacterized protein n=1 Tax=Coniochaeta pulveracea TaxID=177199 RepID=A0A420YDV0_9PEZI|nr:hypothetical protein DL546_003941 [Coniochaeta pulveracea]
MSAKPNTPRLTVITGKLDIHITRNQDGQVLVKIPPAIPLLQPVVDKIILALSGDSNIRISAPSVLKPYTHPYRPFTPSTRKRSNTAMDNEDPPPLKRARISDEAYPGVVFASIETDYDEADPVSSSSTDTDNEDAVSTASFTTKDEDDDHVASSST